jgi:hypothetical protein
VDGSINYGRVESSFAPDAREYNVGAYYNFTDTTAVGNLHLTMYAEERFNYTGVSGETDTSAGIKMTVNF